MKRYDLITNYRCGSAIEEMEPSDDGEWVRWEDVEAETARLRAQLLASDTEVAAPQPDLAHPLESHLADIWAELGLSKQAQLMSRGRGLDPIILELRRLAARRQEGA